MAKRVILDPVKQGSRTPEEFRAAAEAAFRRREQRGLCHVTDPDIDRPPIQPPLRDPVKSSRDSDEDS